jgi:hypothetical protein
MRLEKRIRALEAQLIGDPAILFFSDCSRQEICGRGQFLLDLFCAACDGADLNPVLSAQLELIHQSVCAWEPGSGHMIELVRLALNRPVENDGVADDGGL